MNTHSMSRERVLPHSPPGVVLAAYALGLGYLAALAAFVLVFERPTALGWLGYGIVAAIVAVVTTVAGRVLREHPPD